MVFQLIREFIWQEGESFVSSARKAFGISNLIISPFALAYGIYWMWLGFDLAGKPSEVNSGEEAGAGAVIEGVLSLLLGLILITNAFVMRQFGSVSDLHITSFMWSVLLPVIGTTFCIPEFGNRSLLLWYSIQCVVAQSSHAPVQCSIAFVVQMMSCYNHAYLDYQTVLHMPGARLGGPPLEILGELMGSTVVVNSVVLAVYLQGKVYRETYNEAKSLAAARAAQELTIELVQMLRRYDLEGVGQTLDFYRDSDIDPQLLKNFAAMKNNLEHYRPHLPNYVFIEADRQDRDVGEHRHSVFALPPPNMGRRPGPLISGSPPGERGGGEQERGYSNSSPGSGGSMGEHPTINVSGDNGGEQSTARRSREYQGLHSNSAHSPTAAGVTSDAVESFLESSVVINDDHSFLMNAPSEGHNTPESTSLPSNVSLVPSVPTFAFGSRKITFALIDCHRLTRNHQERELRHFVNTIFSIANDTQASIHTFLGDVVQVTWNATGRIAQHELKAAKFIGRLSKEASEKGSYSIAGAACSGPVRCYNVAAVPNLQRALLVHAVWNGALRSLFNLASRFKTSIIDAPTHAVAHYDIECRGIDILQCSGWEDTQDPVYELLLEKTTGGVVDRSVGLGRGAAESRVAEPALVSPTSAPHQHLGFVAPAPQQQQQPSSQLPGSLPSEQTQGSPLVTSHDHRGGGGVTSMLGMPGVTGSEDVRSPSLNGSQTFQQLQLPPSSVAPPLSTTVLGGAVSPLRSAHAHHDGSKVPSSSFVYEIIPEQFSGKIKENDYIAQQARATANAPNAVINSIIESIASGQISQAFAKLHELQAGTVPEKAVMRAPLVQRLIRHCEAVLASREPNASGSSAQ